MRTIKFRGQRIDGKGFAEGDLLIGQGYKKGNYYILPHLDYYPSDCDTLDGYKVYSSSVGQFTGLLDKNGKEIYEGDIIIEKLKGKRKDGELFEIVFEEFQWFVKNKYGGRTSLSLLNDFHVITIIGNIHDNPELLKGGEK